MRKDLYHLKESVQLGGRITQGQDLETCPRQCSGKFLVSQLTKLPDQINMTALYPHLNSLNLSSLYTHMPTTMMSVFRANAT
jgi:hypothetical protein